MKRIVLALLGVLVLAAPALAQISKLQSTSDGVSTAVTTKTVTFLSNNTAGSTIVVAVRIGATGRTITVSDNDSNTYPASPGDVTQAQTTDGHQDYIFHAFNIGVTPNAKIGVTVAISGAAASLRFSISEWSGLGASPTLDGTNSNQGNSSTAMTTGNITTTGSDLVFVQGSSSSGSLTYTISNPWTAVENPYGGGGTGVAADEAQLGPSPGTFNGAITASANTNWAAEIVAYKPTAGGHPHQLTTTGVGMMAQLEK